MPTRTALRLAAVAAVLAGTAAAAAVLLRDDPEDAACAALTRPVSGQEAEFVTAANLLPDGSVGDLRRPVVDAVQGLRLGPVVAGRFYPQVEEVPTVVPLRDGALLARSPRGPDETGSLSAVALPAGTVQWSRTLEGPSPGGGLVEDVVVTLVAEPGAGGPVAVAHDPVTGDTAGCAEVPSRAGVSRGGTLRADQAGSDVVVAAGPVAAPVTLSRVDPRGGETRWSRELPDAEAGSADVDGDTVVVGRFGRDPVRRAELAGAGGMSRPAVTAYDAADGSPRWTYPEATRVADTAVSVVSVADGQVVLLESHGREPVRLVRLSLKDGAEDWSVSLGAGYWEAQAVVTGAGTLVLAQGPASGEGSVLRAYAAGEDRPRWSLLSRDLPGLGRDPRTGFGAATVVGEDLLLPAPNGLVRVDPATGEAERLDAEVEISSVTPVQGWLLVRARDALLVVSARS